MAVMDSMSTRNMERVRYVTSNYNYLQGLKILPAGLLFLAYAAMQVGWLSLSGWWAGAINIGAISVAILLAYLAHRYYNRTFGRVLSAPLIPHNPNWAAIIGVWVTLLGLLIGAAFLDEWLHPQVILFELTTAVITFAYYWPRRAFAAHYLAVAVILALISLLPLTGADANSKMLNSSTVSFFILGLLFVVGGIFDHILLARTLKPLPEAENDQSI